MPTEPSDKPKQPVGRLFTSLVYVLQHISTLVWKFFANFATADRIAEARSWAMRGGSADIIEKRLLTLFLDNQKSRKFQIFVKDEANSRCLVDMYIPPLESARASHWRFDIFCVRLLQVCSFNEDGQCESL